MVLSFKLLVVSNIRENLIPNLSSSEGVLQGSILGPTRKLWTERDNTRPLKLLILYTQVTQTPWQQTTATSPKYQEGRMGVKAYVNRQVFVTFTKSIICDESINLRVYVPNTYISLQQHEGKKNSSLFLFFLFFVAAFS